LSNIFKSDKISEAHKIIICKKRIYRVYFIFF